MTNLLPQPHDCLIVRWEGTTKMYLDSYTPPTFEWTTVKKTAFWMSEESAARRLAVVQETYPDAYKTKGK